MRAATDPPVECGVSCCTWRVTFREARWRDVGDVDADYWHNPMPEVDLKVAKVEFLRSMGSNDEVNTRIRPSSSALIKSCILSTRIRLWRWTLRTFGGGVGLWTLIGHMGGPWMLRQAMVALELHTDVTELFSWNTKQVFLWISIDYVNERNVRNDVRPPSPPPYPSCHLAWLLTRTGSCRSPSGTASSRRGRRRRSTTPSCDPSTRWWIRYARQQLDPHIYTPCVVRSVPTLRVLTSVEGRVGEWRGEDAETTVRTYATAVLLRVQLLTLRRVRCAHRDAVCGGGSSTSHFIGT
jgi:hypothetical protein